MSKIVNQVKPNDVNAAYLFLGIGGCGSEIVKRVAAKCHAEECNNISFVCMDTDVNDLKSIEDKYPFIKTVQTSTTQTVGAFLDNDDDARKNWFPKSAVMYDKTMSEGAGQVRAISRLAFDATIKTGRIKPLKDAIDELFRKTGNKMKQSVRCIIASTSSGGTGSGMILPTAMYVRDYIKEKYPNSSLLTRALLLLPETLDSVIDSQTERNSQARNGYATVKELNAFMMKGSGFVDLDPDLKQYAELKVQVPIAGSTRLKTLSNLPIDFCFLMDGQDSEDSTLVSYEQYKEQAAIALYEQNIGPMHKKAASTEDNIIKELAKAKGRNRFGGIGAGIIRYPYNEIVKYIAYDLAEDAIGGNGVASKWTRYDREVEKYKLDCKKQGIPSTERIDERQIFIDCFKNNDDSFTKDLRNAYLLEADKAVSKFLGKVEETIIAKNAAEEISEAERYREPQNYDSKKDNAAKTAISTVNSMYEFATKRDRDGQYAIESKVKREAQAMMSNTDVSTYSFNAGEYTLESFIAQKEIKVIAHPCAARCMLYKLEMEIEKRIKTYTSDINNLESVFDGYETNKYEFKSIKQPKRVTGYSALTNMTLKGFKKKQLEEYYKTLNTILPGFCDSTMIFYETKAKLVALANVLTYVKKISEKYKEFFDKFENKVKKISRDKEDIVNALNYRKGDSVFNVCSQKSILDYLSATSIHKIGNDSALLTAEINGEIFDQIKKNALAALDQELCGDDLSVSSHSRDIFDDVLMKHFQKDVRNKCDAINVDIINAIALEYRLNGEKKAQEENEAFEYKVNDAEAYIKKILEKGKRIAAPSIQKLLNEEPRTIERCAYCKDLLDNRTFNVKNLLEKGDSTDTISVYEIRFFNALYNITPSGLKKFSAPVTTETGFKEGGVYFKAYQDYSKYIGPDSTKNAAMSTHIDKRWDSIKNMPEIDDEYQQGVVNNIHKAFIYGIIHGAILHKPLSTKASGKLVYLYKNSDDRIEQLVVPNGTLCDEFYEILDALYVNAKVVEDINSAVKMNKRRISEAKNCNYEETEFFKDMASFDIFKFYRGEPSIELTQEEVRKKANEVKEKMAKASKTVSEGVDGVNPGSFDNDELPLENQTSLFAIPLVYYYSLPNSARFESELISMVDAVIDVFREEYTKWEKEEDAKFVLCDRIVNEFKRLNNNYHKYAEGEFNVPKDINECEVIDVVRRRIKEVLRESPEPEDFEQKMDDISKHNNK